MNRPSGGRYMRPRKYIAPVSTSIYCPVNPEWTRLCEKPGAFDDTLWLDGSCSADSVQHIVSEVLRPPIARFSSGFERPQAPCSRGARAAGDMLRRAECCRCVESVLAMLLCLAAKIEKAMCGWAVYGIRSDTPGVRCLSGFGSSPAQRVRLVVAAITRTGRHARPCARP